MAGGVSQTLGVLFLILGVVLLLGGLGAVAYAYFTEQENQGDNFGLTQNPEETDQNTMIALAGAGGAALGLILIILGAVSFGVGRGRANRAMMERMGGARTGGSAAPAEAPPEPNSPVGRYARPILVGGIVLFLLIAGLAAAITLGAGDELLGGGGNDEPVSSVVGTATFHGNVTGGVPVPGGSVNLDPGGENGADFEPPANATRAIIALDWTPADAGTEELLIEIWVDGTEVTEEAGTGPITFEVTFPAGSTLHYAVFASGTTPSGQQPFRIDVTYMS